MDLIRRRWFPAVPPGSGSPVSGGGGGRGRQGPAGAPGPGFEPARTLFVAQSWPAGVNPAVFFTSIPPALTAAAALTPTISDPVLVVVFPGTYADPLTLVSNVHIASFSRRDVLISGATTWAPGAGVNAPQTAANEFIGVVHINFSAPISVDATAKAADLSTLELRDCGVSGLTHLARPALLADRAQIFDSICFGGPISFDETNGNIYHSFVLDLTVDGGATTMQGHQVFGPVSVLAGTLNIDQADVVAPITVSAGAFFSSTGSLLASTITSLAGASVDIRRLRQDRIWSA